MKYFSEKTKKMYESVDELNTAEKEFDDKAAKNLALREERSARAKEIELLFKEANEKYSKANKALQDFTKEYGSYHLTIKDNNLPAKSLFELFFDNWLF